MLKTGTEILPVNSANTGSRSGERAPGAGSNRWTPALSCAAETPSPGSISKLTLRVFSARRARLAEPTQIARVELGQTLLAERQIAAGQVLDHAVELQAPFGIGAWRPHR